MVAFTGLERDLPRELRPGALYFTTDTLRMFVDLKDQRILMATGKQVPLCPDRIIQSDPAINFDLLNC